MAEQVPAPMSAIETFMAKRKDDHDKYVNGPMPIELFLQPHEVDRLEFMKRFREDGLQYAGGPEDGAYLFLRSLRRA